MAERSKGYHYRNPKILEGQVLGLIRKYNVMPPEQICAFFPGEERAVSKCLQRLEQNRQIMKNPYTGLISSSALAYSLKDEGTICTLWVLIDLIKKKPVEGHFLAEKEEYPTRIILFSSQEVYDILYVGTGDIKLINGIFEKRKSEHTKHIVAVEKAAVMDEIRIPGVVGFCLVKENGEVEYYRKSRD